MGTSQGESLHVYLLCFHSDWTIMWGLVHSCYVLLQDHLPQWGWRGDLSRLLLLRRDVQVGDSDLLTSDMTFCLIIRGGHSFATLSIPPAYSRPPYSPLGDADMADYSAKCHEDFGKRDDKYWERRRKNNLAAKKSRDSRRIRENQMRLRVLCLENANQMLKEEMDRKDVELSNLK